MVPFLKDINRVQKLSKEDKIKQYSKIIFTEGVGDRILITTFQNFNAVDISMLRQLNRVVNFLIVRNNTEFAFLSNDARDNEQKKPLPNLSMFRMLNRFKGI
jgi:selenophosphate synthase